MNSMKYKVTWKTALLQAIGTLAFLMYLYLFKVDIATTITTARHIDPSTYFIAIVFILLDYRMRMHNQARSIGALILQDEEGEDPKILSVPIKDPRFDGFKDVTDVHPHLLIEIREFFETYKRLEPRKFVSFKARKEAGEAKKIIKYAMNLYKKNYGRTATRHNQA